MLRISKLTFLNVFVIPMALGLGACFFGDDEGLDETSFSGTGGGSCDIGAAGCPCTSQGACDPELMCVDGLDTCIYPTGCDIGSAGCECTAGGSCDANLICNTGFCVSDMPCLPEQTGTEGCQCTMGEGCDVGLDCLSGVCVNLPETTTSETTTGDSSSTSSGTGTDTDATATDPSSSGGDSVDEGSAG
jgi:hypothetical protein